jgi:hypothetical protein
MVFIGMRLAHSDNSSVSTLFPQSVVTSALQAPSTARQ